MTLKLAIWDIDGTIVDSRDVIQSAMVSAFTKNGLSAPDYDRTRQIVGLALREAIGIMEPDVDPQMLDKLTQDYKQAFILQRSNPDFREPLYPGALDLLKDLSADGWLMGVATGKSRQGLRAIMGMHDMADLFDTQWCADDGPGKPHPFMVLENMRALGCEPEQTLMIGDAVFDMQMARAARVTAHGVSWGFGASHEIEAAGAHELHHDFEGLRQALSRFAEERAA